MAGIGEAKPTRARLTSNFFNYLKGHVMTTTTAQEQAFLSLFEREVTGSIIEDEIYPSELASMCVEAGSFLNFRDKLIEYVEEACTWEVIYYTNAMKYLMEYDVSLQESMQLAYELGYTCKDINSELLATLLKRSHAMEEVHQWADAVRPAIERVFANDFADEQS